MSVSSVHPLLAAAVSKDAIEKLLSPVPLAFITNLVLKQFLHPASEYILGTYILANAGVLYYNVQSTGTSVGVKLPGLGVNNAIFLMALFVFTAIRRLYFHPLSKFPGPKIRAITSLRETFDHLNGNWSHVVIGLHKKYDSPIIRTGPNEISVLDADSLPVLFPRPAPAHDCRGNFYNLRWMAGPSLQNEPDHEIHRQKRKIWDRAFRGQAVDGYAIQVEDHVNRCIKTINERMEKGKCERNATKMVGGFAWDVMGDLAFGISNFGMQDGTGDSTYMDILHGVMSLFVVIGNLNDVVHILKYLPLPPVWKKFRAIEAKMLKARSEMSTMRKDIFSELSVDPDTGKKRDLDDLIADIDLLVIAGSDTTASALANTLYELCRKPAVADHLYSELRTLFHDESEITTASVRNIPYLDGIINEALRLWPPVPPGAHARVGPQGATCAGQFVPPFTSARVVAYGLMRDERYFSQPEVFEPNRWIGEGKKEAGDPDVLNRSAHIPFSTGSHLCVGKQLAMLEMRYMLAKLVWNFEMRFGKRHSDSEFKKGWKDYFTSVAGPVWVEFTPRNK